MSQSIGGGPELVSLVANPDQNLVTIGSKESRLASMLELLAPTGSS